MKPIVIGNALFQDGSFNLCVTIAPSSIEELTRDLVRLKLMEFDLIEWRADYLISHNNLDKMIKEGLLKIRSAFNEKPFLFTFRWDQEGGRNPLSAKEILSVRKTAVESGAIDLLDVEVYWLRNAQSDEKLELYVNLLEEAKSLGIRCILSWHDFVETPEEEMLLKILSTQMKLGADICKVTTMAKTEEDTVRVMEVSRRAAKVLDVPHIALAMGDYGKSSRYDKANSQSCITFAPVDNASAPGQLSLEELKKRLEKYDEIL